MVIKPWGSFIIRPRWYSPISCPKCPTIKLSRRAATPVINKIKFLHKTPKFSTLYTGFVVLFLSRWDLVWGIFLEPWTVYNLVIFYVRVASQYSLGKVGPILRFGHLFHIRIKFFWYCIQLTNWYKWPRKSNHWKP